MWKLCQLKRELSTSFTRFWSCCETSLHWIWSWFSIFVGIVECLLKDCPFAVSVGSA